MLKILRTYGIPDSSVNCIGTLHENTKARVLTENFEIIAGDLAPYIFIIVIDYVMRMTIDDYGDRVGFTDDLALHSKLKVHKRC